MFEEQKEGLCDQKAECKEERVWRELELADRVRPHGA